MKRYLPIFGVLALAFASTLHADSTCKGSGCSPYGSYPSTPTPAYYSPQPKYAAPSYYAKPNPISPYGNYQLPPSRPYGGKLPAPSQIPPTPPAPAQAAGNVPNLPPVNLGLPIAPAPANGPIADPNPSAAPAPPPGM